MRFQNGCNQPMHFDSSFSGIQVRGNLFASYDGQRLTYSNLDPSSTILLPLFLTLMKSLILEEVQNSVY
jgi:hypothetical protein